MVRWPHNTRTFGRLSGGHLAARADRFPLARWPRVRAPQQVMAQAERASCSPRREEGGSTGSGAGCPARLGGSIGTPHGVSAELCFSLQRA